MRVCRTCKTPKPDEAFWWKVAGVRRLAHCKDCERRAREAPEAKAAAQLRSRTSYLKLRDRQLEKSLLKRYGITLAVYREMLDSQGGMCAICGSTEGRRALCVDHNHKTGQVRSLLCDNCNQGVGRFKDDPTLMRKAADYIEQHSESEEATWAS